MGVGIIKPQEKFGNVLIKILEVPAIFVFTKEFPKIQREKCHQSIFALISCRKVKSF
jgi:hypothetical protein